MFFILFYWCIDREWLIISYLIHGTIKNMNKCYCFKPYIFMNYSSIDCILFANMSWNLKLRCLLNPLRNVWTLFDSLEISKVGHSEWQNLILELLRSSWLSFCQTEMLKGLKQGLCDCALAAWKLSINQYWRICFVRK